MDNDLQVAEILGVKITTSEEEEILEYITKSLQKKTEEVFITTPNPEILVYAEHYSEYKHILNQAQIALPDGIGVVMAAKLLGKGIKRRISGVDFMEKLCKESVKSALSIGLLGGRPGIALKAANCLREKYREIKISVIEDRFQQENPKYESKQKNYHKYSKMLFDTFPKVDILFVAYGHPKQEEWIYKNLEYLPVKVAMGVGGAFDYLSGEVTRAPKVVRTLGLEWFYRLIRQPWRWRRQLSLVEFCFLVLKEKFTKA